MIFYILVFSLLAVFVVVVGVTRMRGRRSGYTASDSDPVSGSAGHQHTSTPEHATSHGHPMTKAARKSRKAKRAESRHDRRKRK